MFSCLKKSARIAGMFILTALAAALMSCTPAAEQKPVQEPTQNTDEIKRLLDKVAALEADNTSLIAENTSLERENAKLDTKNEYLSSEISRNESEINRLEREINRLEREIGRNNNIGTALNLALLVFNVAWAVINKFRFIEKLKEKFKKKKPEKSNRPEIQEPETQTIQTEEGEIIT